MQKDYIEEKKKIEQNYQNIINNYQLKSRVIWEIIEKQKIINKKTKKIPKVIIQYWDDINKIPNDVIKCMNTWKRFSDREIRYILFDKNSARRFIKENYDQRYVVAFDRCFHPALQSDYFRLCYIFKYGGVYIDADDECICDEIEFLFIGEKLIIQAMCYDLETNKMIKSNKAYEEKFSNKKIYYVNNNPIIAPPNNPIIEKALNMATENLLKNSLSSDFQSIAGPGNMVNSIVWCKLKDKKFNSYINIDINWDDKAVSKWPLEYRNDTRNWRNIKIER